MYVCMFVCLQAADVGSYGVASAQMRIQRFAERMPVVSELLTCLAR